MTTASPASLHHFSFAALLATADSTSWGVLEDSHFSPLTLQSLHMRAGLRCAQRSLCTELALWYQSTSSAPSQIQPLQAEQQTPEPRSTAAPPLTVPPVLPLQIPPPPSTRLLERESELLSPTESVAPLLPASPHCQESGACQSSESDSTETRERLRLFFLAERSRVRAGHLRLGATEVLVRLGPPCLDATNTTLLFSDVLMYGEDRPPTAFSASTDFLTDDHLGVLRRVPPGRDNLVMAAMASAWRFPHTTIPSVSAFKDSLRAFFQSTLMQFHTAAGLLQDLSTILTAGSQGVPLAGPPGLARLDSLEAVMLFAIAGYFQQKLELYNVVTQTWTVFDLDGQHRTSQPLVLIQDFDADAGAILYVAMCSRSQATAYRKAPPRTNEVVPYCPLPSNFAPKPPDGVETAHYYDHMEATAAESYDMNLYGSAGDLNIATLNVNGSLLKKLPEIVSFMAVQSIDILCLQDTRTIPSDYQEIGECVRGRLGANAQCFFSDCSLNGASLDPTKVLPKLRSRRRASRVTSSIPQYRERPSVGGQLVIVNPLWAGATFDKVSDPTSLGIFGGVKLKLVDDSELLLLSTYWPVPAKNGVPSDSDALWRRLQAFQSSDAGEGLNPLTFIQAHTMKMVNSHMGTPGNSTILAGDLNASWFQQKKASHHLYKWASDNLWRNGVAECLTPMDRVYSKWSNPHSPTSWIDQVLFHASSPFQCTGGGSSEGPWCSKVSDHRPIICSFAGPTLLISSDMAHLAVSAKPRLVKKHLQTAPHMLGNYQDALMTSLAGLSTPTTNAERADRLLLISSLSVAAVPRACTNPSQLRFPKRKDGWSLVYLAHKLQHETLIEIRRRALGVRVRHPWRSSVDLQLGLRRLVTRWELSVRNLKWPDGNIDPEVWRYGTPPGCLAHLKYLRTDPSFCLQSVQQRPSSAQSSTSRTKADGSTGQD